MSGQGRYHHVGHRNFLVGDGVLEGLPKGGPDLDADIGQRWRFMRQHEYHISILALPHAQRGVTSPPSSPLNGFASPYGREGIRLPTLWTAWPLSTGLSWSFPMASSVASCPPILEAGRCRP